MEATSTIDGLDYRWRTHRQPTRSYLVLHVQPVGSPERSLRALFWEQPDEGLSEAAVAACVRHGRQHGWGRDIWLDSFEIPDAVRLPPPPPAELPAPTASAEADRQFWRERLGVHSVAVLVSPYPRWHTGRWALQLADPTRLGGVLEALAFEPLTPGQRFAGVEVAMAMLEEQPTAAAERTAPRLRALLLRETWLHAYTVLQWCCEERPWPDRPAVRLASELHEAIYDRGM